MECLMEMIYFMLKGGFVQPHWTPLDPHLGVHILRVDILAQQIFWE